MLANNSAMGVTTIAANVTMTSFIILRAVELSDVLFIVAFVAELTLCHPQQLFRILHLQLHTRCMPTVLHWQRD